MSKYRYNGWIALDKTAGISSFYPIKKIKFLTKHKVGHTGTLDPFATGVLAVAIGDATRLIEYASHYLKEYQFTLKFGQETDTLDTEGIIVNVSNKIVKIHEIENILHEFIGHIKQTPPKFSAVKINGKRAYALARENIDFNIKERNIYVKDLKLLSFDEKTQTAEFYTSCGGGTYIRTLGSDIAKKIDTVGYLSRLNRSSVGIFNKNNAISLDNFIEMVHNDNLDKYLKPIDIVLDDILAINLSESEANKIKNGCSINRFMLNNSVIRAYYNKELVAIGKVYDNYFQPIKVFNNKF